MPIYSRKPDSDFQLAPEGLFQAVCCDVIDLGMLETKWGKKHKVRFRWQIDERDDNRKRFQIQQSFTNSLHEKASLRGMLKSWRGRDFTEEELMQFDLETVLKANCQINIVHAETEKGTWANVSAIVPIVNGVNKITVEDYVRMCDRQPDDTPATGQQQEPFQASEEDVPF